MKKPTRREIKAHKSKLRHRRQGKGNSFRCGICEVPTTIASGNYGGRAICSTCATFLGDPTP